MCGAGYAGRKEGTCASLPDSVAGEDGAARVVELEDDEKEEEEDEDEDDDMPSSKTAGANAVDEFDASGSGWHKTTLRASGKRGSAVKNGEQNCHFWMQILCNLFVMMACEVARTDMAENIRDWMGRTHN